MDRLTPVDAGFLHQEGPTTHMHVGGVALFEGPPPTHRELLDHIRHRLPLVPRYRQKIVTPPLWLGRQRWIDDPNFNLEYHVRHTALAAPGEEEQLRRLAARIYSQALDRSKPLWEMWLVEGVSGGRFALITKNHHALVDGIAGVDLMTTLFDTTRKPREQTPGDDWNPRPQPGPSELSVTGLRETAGALGAMAGLPLRAAAAAVQPGKAAGQVAKMLEAVADVARGAILAPAPPSPLNVPITPHRRLAFAAARLEDFKAVKNAFGGTVNDVVLTAVAGALRRFYEFRGEDTEGVTLRVAVPVSTRGDDHGAFGNRVTQVVAPHPLERLQVIRRAMDGIKDSKQAMGAEAIVGMQDFAPPTILAQASRLNFNNRLFNLLVTNVPGPQMPIYALGRELQTTYPIAFLAGDRALAIALLSYNGGVYFGLLADYDALPDIDVIVDGLEHALAELVELAHEATDEGRRPKKRPAAGASPNSRGARAQANGSPGNRPPTAKATGAARGAAGKAPEARPGAGS
jgi:diacylglycerol O-acyltransferase